MLTKLSKHRLGIKKLGEKDSGNADLGKTQVLKSHGDRTNTFGVANGRQEMSVLITNSLPCTERSARPNMQCLGQLYYCKICRSNVHLNP